MQVVKKIIVMCLLCVGVFSCASNNSSIDYRTDFDFSTLQRFTILPIDKAAFSNPKVSEIEVNRITELMDAELSKRYSSVSKDQADFLVRYHLVVEDRVKVDTYNASVGMYRGGYGYHYGMQSPQVKNTYYEHGSIIVDIIDKASGDVVWRGSTEGKVKNNPKPAERDERVARHLAELFARFPPSVPD